MPNTACLDDAQVAADRAVRPRRRRAGRQPRHVALRRVRHAPRTNFALAACWESITAGFPTSGNTAGQDEIDVNFAKSIGPDYWEKRKNVFDFSRTDLVPQSKDGCRPTSAGESVTFKGPAVRVAVGDRAAKVVGTLRPRAGRNPAGREIPAVVTRTHGKGRVVYLAAGFDAANYLYPYPYQRLLLAKAIRWAAAAAPPVEVEAPMCVHATVMRQKKANASRLIVHLFSDLNTTAFHALPVDDVPLREEVVPIHDIQVRFSPSYRFRRFHLEPEGTELTVMGSCRHIDRGAAARYPFDGGRRAGARALGSMSADQGAEAVTGPIAAPKCSAISEGVTHLS